MRYIFSSPYYLKDRATGANKRFESILYELQDKHDVGIVVSKGQIPKKISQSVSIYEIPLFIARKRILTFVYLNILYLYFVILKNIVINDFNPIPLSMFFSKRQFQLIHDARIFDDFGRWNRISSWFMKFQWKYVKNKIVVSQFTKDRLCKELRIKESSVIVSYNGVYPSDFESIGTEERDIDLLYVATFEERKNHINLIKALDLIEQPLKVVFLGKDLGLREEIKLEAAKLKEHQIILLDAVSEDELARLYRTSKIFISPSLYEGFGMPILEAYAYGCKVLCSDIYVFHEVLGDNAVYFESSNQKDIERSLLENINIDYNFDLTKINLTTKKFLWPVIALSLFININHNQ